MNSSLEFNQADEDYRDLLNEYNSDPDQPDGNEASEHSFGLTAIVFWRTGNESRRQVP